MLINVDIEKILHNYYPIPVEEPGYICDLPSMNDAEADLVVVGQRSMRTDDWQ